MDADEQANERVVREFFRLLADNRAADAVDLLAPDVEWRNTGLPTFRGPRVGAMLRDTEKRGVTVDIEVHHAAATGDVVLTDRTDTLRLGRWSTSFWVRGTLRVSEGRIVLWDDAFSWADLVRGGVVGLRGLL